MWGLHYVPDHHFSGTDFVIIVKVLGRLLNVNINIIDIYFVLLKVASQVKFLFLITILNDSLDTGS